MDEKNKQGEDSKERPDFKHYLVLLLDLLGQKHHLKKLRRLPTTPDEEESYKEAVRRTLLVVDKIREAFKFYFDAYADHRVAHVRPRELTPVQAAAKWAIANREPPTYQHFSDTILIWAPATDLNSKMSSEVVFSFLGACAGVLTFALSHDIPLRGGIDVGVATRYWGKEIYGPALMDVHGLESKVAEYPRIVVGDELINFLHSFPEARGSDLISASNRVTADTCKGLIERDEDGAFFVDFLGSQVREIRKNREGVVEDYRRAIAFVSREHERFLKQRNQKLALRYSRLLTYMKDREHLWIKSDSSD